MADREPRRRKKRRDSQKKVHFSEDVRTEEQIFSSHKSDHDSDLDIDEEIDHHSSHQAGSLSKIVFIVLFSGLIVSLGVIYISLQGADKGPVDIFEASHDDHAEVAHGEHLDEGLHGHGHDDSHGHDEPEDEVSLEDFIESGIDKLRSFISSKDTEIDSDEDDDDDDENDEITSNDAASKPETSNDQDTLEEDAEEITTLPPEPVEEEVIVPEEDYSSTQSSYVYDEYPYSELQEDTTPPSYEPVSEDPIRVEDDLSEDDLSMYERADITNEEDYLIREQLDEVNSMLEKSPEKVLLQTEELLKNHSQSPRVHYMKAQAFDKLAELHRSNKYLEEAIAAYQKVMACENVPEKLYLLSGRRAADRLRFRGFTGKSVKLLTEMTKKFPTDVDLKNEVAVGYLLIGQNVMAKNVLLDVLKMAPDSGFAKVHLGFILKTDESNYKDSIKYLSEGIASKEPGVIDGRFYFHLGDALHRTGKKEEALKVYEDAVKEGLFLSVYQRSLYNVNSLTGKPWWEPHKIRYSPDFKILEKHWVTIRDEALSLIDEKYPGFLPETEDLQETGDWKQLELFARGRKIEKNCQKAPKTCAIIAQIPDAVSCKRGQVKFSIMLPGTHVWPHTGPTNCRLRSHLGLVIPEGVSIRVADETRKWEEGKVILFDDSFEHEVWHNGSTFRLVLIVDFWHPELTSYHKRTLSPI